MATYFLFFDQYNMRFPKNQQSIIGLEDYVVAIHHIDNLELVVVPFGIARYFGMWNVLCHMLATPTNRLTSNYESSLHLD